MDREADRVVGGREGLRAAAVLVASVVACLVLAAAAGAQTVTIGTPTASFTSPSGQGQGQGSCTCTQYQLTTSGLGGGIASAPGWTNPSPTETESVPANGVIIDWHVSGSGNLALQALRPSTGLGVVGGGTGQAATAGDGFPARSVHIPVQAGDLIGVLLSGNNAQVNFSPNADPNAKIGEILSSPSPFAPLTPGGLLLLNADVALTPVVTSISATSGSTGGGTVTTITGTYLDGSTSVKFGAVPASSFTIVSPTEIEASAPAQNAGTVDVTVGGPGGTSATLDADKFTYVAPPPQLNAGNTQAPGGSAGAGGSSLVISPLSLSASYFLAAPSGASIAKKVATGTKLTYVVSAPATTTFVIQQGRPGRLLPANSKGVRSCVPTTKAIVTLTTCTRYVGLTPTLTHKGGAGPNVVRLSGRLGGHALPAGPYRLVATATSTAVPTVVSAPVTHAFHILAPSKSSKTTTKPKAHAALPSTGSGASSAPA